MGRGDQVALDEILEAFPWPDELTREAGPPLDVLWTLEVPAPPAVLWTHLVETSRLNRALGLSRLAFEEHEGVLHGSATIAGLEHRWVELPWDWVSGRVMRAERRYSKGLARHVRVIYQLEPTDTGTRLKAYFGWIVRSWLGGWALSWGMRSLERRFRELLAALATTPADTTPELYTFAAQPLSQSALRLLASKRQELLERGIHPDAVANLADLIEGGDESDVARLQARRLAHDWQLPEREVLRTCLHATRVGLLELSWDVICPHCRGVREEVNNLGEVPDTSSCEACQIEFGTDAAHAVEVTFRIHPSIRTAAKQMFCSAQAATQRHIEVQQVLAAGETRTLAVELRAGRYRARVKGEAPLSFIDVVEDGEDATLAWHAGAEGSTRRVRSRFELTLVNDSAAPKTFVVEDVNWADDALLPKHVFSFQEFRDLFSEQYIGSDVQLAVGEQTIVFTDIVGSTRLYVERGDPEAFVAVREHFADIFRIVADHDGVVVKTIGDATMSAFSDTVSALRATREMQRRFAAEDTAFGVRLRISVNLGLCIAVNLNSNIDYFGHTVNVAAKLQLCAGAGDIALSEAVHHAPGVASYLASVDAALERVDLDLPALDQRLAVWRWATVSTSAVTEGRRAGAPV